MADHARANANPPQLAPGSTGILMRRISAVVLGIYLYATASPFSPVSWLTQPDWITYLDGPRLLDRLISPILLVGAAILHWYIASQRTPLAITLSIPTGQQIRDGRVEVANNDIVLGLWQPHYYWPSAAAEVAILYAIVSGGMMGEFASRCTVVGIVVSAWVLGWNAMPWYRKEQAWALIKDYVIRLIIMEMIDSAFGGGRSNRRRRRRV